MKVGWIVTRGPDNVRKEAIGRLEVIADTFLSMSAPTQLALPHWLLSRNEIQAQIRSRIQANLESLAQSGLERFASDGGWSAVLRLPRLSISGRTLLGSTGVIVHPGSFYGMAEPERIVVSLISQEDVFQEGISRIASVAN
jgi:aspartate/methionine/tyrosine aminotransferase